MPRIQFPSWIRHRISCLVLFTVQNSYCCYTFLSVNNNHLLNCMFVKVQVSYLVINKFNSNPQFFFFNALKN